MRYRVETTAPEALKALPFVWEVEPDKGGDIYTVYAEGGKALEILAVSGITSAKELNRHFVIDLRATPEAQAKLNQAWQRVPTWLQKTLKSYIYVNYLGGDNGNR